MEGIGGDDITALTERATNATFYRDDLRPDEIEANRRVVRISAEAALGAIRNSHQFFAAAFVDGAFAGYVISTVHASDSRELDWLMVDPAFHGNGVADALMSAGVDWLGRDRPMWLNVLQHNRRAVRFYEKHDFAIDPDARTEHLIPHFIMRRRPKVV
ncbi:GNAT family N-acetyltransferase [Sphingomonas daechungensis]|uniref:GNAT family N-acetyltransferase n=1 Tax=Sphingomonas daechungensis TaxID=1176646 RepID=UPI0037846BF5